VNALTVVNRDPISVLSAKRNSLPTQNYVLSAIALKKISRLATSANPTEKLLLNEYLSVSPIKHSSKN
jgi:hypothetical protein